MISMKIIGSTRQNDCYGGDRERVLAPDGISPTLRSTDYKEPVKIGIPLGVIDTQGRLKKKCQVSETVPTIKAQHHRHHPEVVIPVLTPDKMNKPGMYVQLTEDCMAYAVWYEKEQCYIVVRRLTPKECFRLQGWTDDYFEKAAFVNSDSQLYKQAGNGVTVTVVYDIATKMSG